MCAGFALAITVCNSVVVGVLFINKKLMNAQVVYRISLAFTDIIVGIIVYPSLLFNMFHHLTGKLEIKRNSNTSSFILYQNDSNVTLDLNAIKDNQVVRSPLPSVYGNTVGFFTTITLIVSVNTLTIAAIDRFAAIYRPLRYRMISTTSIAWHTSVVIWLLSVFVGVLPLWTENLWYVVQRITIVHKEGNSVSVIYLFTFCLQLILMWFFTVASIVVYKKRSNALKNMRANNLHQNELSKHGRLIGTLGLMAGAFSLTLIPLILYLPYGILDDEDLFKILKLSSQNSTNYYSVIQIFVTAIFLTNSLSNFFIYSARDKKFRKAFKKIFCNIQLKKKKTSSNQATVQSIEQTN